MIARIGYYTLLLTALYVILSEWIALTYGVHQWMAYGLPDVIVAHHVIRV